VATTDQSAATETVEKKTTISTSPVHTHAGQESRSFLVTFLLTMIAGPLGLRHFYLGNKKLGWIRTGLFLGGYLWMIVMAFLGQGVLGFLGFVAVASAGIWSIVDFFYVYNAVKTDADGQPLTATARDRRWARTFYLAAIAGVIAAVVLGIAAGTFIEYEIKQGNWNPTGGRSTDRYNRNPTFEQYMQQLQNQNDTNVPSY
jgi:hypothetical protein